MEEAQSIEHDLSQLLSEIYQYDSEDMSASIAGLQLLPENADKSIRLEAFAYAAASLPEEEGKKCISIDKINFLLNKSSFSRGPIKLAEDPMPNPFTESITFLNGSYIVFPWNLEESTFVFRQLIKALFYFNNPFPNSEFIKQATMLISACLVLSNEIAIRAGLKRDMDPISKNEKIYTHGKKTISKLKTAISFSLSELETLLTENGIERNILDRLTIAPGSFSASKYQIEENNLLAKPIVKFKNKIVISIPGMLLPATRNEIILLAKEYGLGESLAMRYNLAVWGSIIESLGYLDNKIINIPKYNLLDISCGRDAFFYLDTDKLIYAIMVTDELINHESFFSEWPTDDLSHKIEARLEYIKEYIASFEQPPNDILFLVLIQGIGRRYFLSFGDRTLPMEYTILGLSAADLETIALLEGGEKLALWKYACSKELIRKNTLVQSIGELNEFYIFRKNDYSYYLSDESRPKGLFIALEGALELRMEVLRKIKRHGVPSFNHGKFKEVIALHRKSNIPLYMPKSVIYNKSENIALFVENYPLPIWIVGPKFGDDSQKNLHKSYAEFAETIGYWLWQFYPMLNPILQCIASKYPMILIRLYLYSDDAWFKCESEIEGLHENPVEVEIDSVNGFIDITLSPTISILLEKEDNSGERYLIQCIIRGMRRLLDGDQESLSEEAISIGLDAYAPLGIKKKIFSLNEANDPRLNPDGLPHYRMLQEWDKNKLLDELGDHLVIEERFSIAKIEDSQRTHILNEKVVDFYYRELEKLIGSLRPQGLLEWLVSYHEAIIYTIAEYNLSIPTRKACFSSEPEIVDILSKDLPQLNNAAMANRFIIEYVTTRPPNGLRPMSCSIYDRILALAHHIINFGFLSDSIIYNISDIKLAILPSMRLGMDREHFEKAHDQYLTAFSTGEVERLTQSFGRYWERNNNSNEKPESIEGIDEATSIEFGHSLTNLLDLMLVAHQIGKKINSVVACMPRNDFVDKIVDHFGWSQEKVNHAIELLSLNSRSDFLRPPSPYKGIDVNPWRFNRALSYIRRPFLCRDRDDSREILWGIRNCIDAGLYLTDLCINGRLKANSQEMKKLQGELSQVRGKEFNIRVGKLLERDPDLAIIYNIKKFGNRRLIDSEGKDLGDIDVLAVNKKNKKLKIIECKDLALARTPYEMGNELKDIFEGSNNDRSIIEKHSRRCDWVKENLDFILKYLNLNEKARWKIEPIIVTDQELFTPYLRKSHIRVLSFSELKPGVI